MRMATRMCTWKSESPPEEPTKPGSESPPPICADWSPAQHQNGLEPADLGLEPTLLTH